MDFDAALAYMEGLIRFGWKLGNERFEALCERLGDPQDRYAVVHIAGTKGKGSTTGLCAGVLRAAGYRVGAYLSPYVFDVRERVQVDGEQISRADFARLVSWIRPHIEALAQTELGQTTEFELKTALGFLYFAERGVDFACVEVGLGGRLDATNVVHPAVTVITNIGLDHTDRLGDTHALIAAEKAGILKQGVPCFTATDHPDALAVIQRIAEERNVPLTRAYRGDASRPTGDASEVRWDLTLPPPAPPGEAHDEGGEAPPVPFMSAAPIEAEAERAQTGASDTPPRLEEHTAPVSIATPTGCYRDLEMRMGGVYQRINAACAVAAAEAALAQRGAPLPERAVREALATTALPGRLSVIRLPQGPLLVLDGAHNGLAARALAGPVAALRAQHRVRALLLVIGMVGGHDPHDVLEVFAPEAERIYACQPDWKRAIPAEEIVTAARRFNPQVSVIPAVPEAVRAAVAIAGPDDMVLVTGSFYTVGEVPVDLLGQVVLEEEKER